MKFKAIAFIIVIALIVVDQISKYTIRHQGGFYICNKGVAFGLKIPEAIIIIFIIIVIIIFLRNQFPKSKLGILLITTGAFSNIIDRIYFGCVIDFINLKFWPVFNLADIYITIGGVIIIFFYVFKGSFRRHNRA